jgi:hypothetical protein
MVDSLVPEAGTPAHQAFWFQGLSEPGKPPSNYVGVDEWVQPDKDIKVGHFLAQFDHRLPAFITTQTATVSEFFTDVRTVMQSLKDGKISAQNYAESVQVAPFRPPTAPVTAAHTYPTSVAIYQVVSPIKAADWELSVPAEYGRGVALNNIHFGTGSAPQVFLKKTRDELLKPVAPGNKPTLELVAIIPCIDTGHRLGWLKELEQQRLYNDQITAAIPTIYKQMLDKLMQGTSQEQEQAKKMVTMQVANKEAKATIIPPAVITSAPRLTTVNTPKAPPPKPTATRRKGPRH